MILDSTQIHFLSVNRKTKRAKVYRTPVVLYMEDVQRYNTCPTVPSYTQLHFYNGSDIYIEHDPASLRRFFEKSRVNVSGFGTN